MICRSFGAIAKAKPDNAGVRCQVEEDMPEILFIADDLRVQALIDDLQPLLAANILLETDYSSGIKAIFDRSPALVFLQHSIAGMSCDRIASKVRSLQDTQLTPMLLLWQGTAGSCPQSDEYESCLDLSLPREELKRQVQQLLAALNASRSAASEELTIQLDFPEELISQLDSPDEPIIRLDSPGEPISKFAPPGELTFEFDYPEELFDGEPFQAALEADAGPDRETAEQSNTLPAQPGAVAEPSPLAELHRSEELRRIERAAPGELFGSMSAPSREGSGGTRELKRKHPEVKGGGSCRNATPGAARQTAPGKELAARAPETAGRPGPGRGTAAPETRPRPTRSRALGWGVSCLVGAGIAALGLYLAWSPTPGKDGLQGRLAAAGTPPAASSPLPAQQLPGFVPKVAPDHSYSVSHPGWQRFQADGLEYLVYREQDRVKAIQVLSGAPGAITFPFFQSCVRESTGDGQCMIDRTELHQGVQVASGSLQQGCQFRIYREMKGGEIRGFVLVFPDAPRPPGAPG